MQWQKMEWPLPAHIVPKDRQHALYYYGEDEVCLTYWDADIKDFRFMGDVAHIYGGREPSYIMLIEAPESGG